MIKQTTRTKITIGTSEPNIRIEVVPGGHCPEINIIHDISGGHQVIGLIATTERLRKLKEALKDV